MVPSNSAPLLALGQVAADLLQRVGMNVEVYAVEFNAMLQRRNRKGPVSEGGWSAFVTNWSGMDWLNPAGYIALRGTGETGYAGWATTRGSSPCATHGSPPRRGGPCRALRDIQLKAMQDVPYYPLGQYLMPTAFRSGLTGSSTGSRPSGTCGRLEGSGASQPRKVGGAMASGPRPAQSSCRICASAPALCAPQGCRSGGIVDCQGAAVAHDLAADDEDLPDRAVAAE